MGPSGGGVEFVSLRVIGAFLAGLIAVPLVTGLPIVFLRRSLMQAIKAQPSVSAFAPFANFALYSLQGLLVWVVTREAYEWVFTFSPIA